MLNIPTLIVEDDKYMNEILCDILDTQTFTVESSDSVSDALVKITDSGKNYRLLILDYKLGNIKGMTGLDIFDIVKAKNPKIKAIMISAHGNNEIRKAAFKKGISRFLDKPFLITDLLNTVYSLADSIEAEGSEEGKKKANNIN